MFKELMDKIYDKFGTEDTMHDMVNLISNTMEEIKEESPSGYHKMISNLEKYLYTISLDEAKDIVSHMYNEYDMKGERWSYDQTTEVAEKYQLPNSINRIDFYIVMNMWNIDYIRTMRHLGLEDNLDAYVMFSCDWLTDCDFGKGKVYKYFIKMHCDEEE